ncbi:MAG TPA: asparagine synthase (glutamine-hydrolyzing), partial [Polyangia bacterium]|nr:asparagine synthase (glutamine-hydrolyzing) [Polyangia bacterium]
FQELRQRLLALGHTFRTDGDGEVLVHGYEEWGDDVARHVEGMFAFILVDRRRRRVIVARDRFGIKPLFWSRAAGAFVFASELKGLLVHPAVERVADTTALVLGRVRHHVPWPLTAFHGVFRLPPGALLQIDSAGHRLVRFASMALPPDEDSRPRRSENIVEEAGIALESAVRRQLIADVPVGAFLSGGIDSTLLVTMMTRLAAHPVHTFSIRTSRRDNESNIAAETARRLGTVHHTIDFSDRMTVDAVASLPTLCDEPFAETSILGVQMLSRAARQEVKVALSGDGGDEVFGGYDTYRVVEWTSRATAWLPSAATELVRTNAERLLSSAAWPDRLRQLLSLLALAGLDAASAHRRLGSTASADAPVLSEFSRRLSARVDALAAPAGAGESFLRQAMATDRVERLTDAMLPKVDLASMSASLEVRVPMLDDALVRFANRLSDPQLASLRWGKLILRQLLDKLLPDGPAWMGKRGFSLPLDVWMRSPSARAQLEQVFVDAEPLLARLGQPSVLRRWRAFASGQRLQLSAGSAAKEL